MGRSVRTIERSPSGAADRDSASRRERLSDWALDLPWRAWSAVVGPSGWRSLVGPSVFFAVAIALLVYNHVNERVTDLVFWLTLGLIITVFLRVIETNRRQSHALEEQRRKALNDSVTGLRNRRSLEADVDASLAGGEPAVLVLVELDGLQDYKDRFGYAEGDEALRGIAAGLVEAAGELGGGAYRIDGSRLAALIPERERPLGEIVLAVTGSLRGDERDPQVASSHGEVALPADAEDAALALRIASQRLAAHRRRQHRSARRQAHAVLMAAFGERHPESREELRVAAYRAISLARRMGVPSEEIDDIALAAELRDIGRLAAPEAGGEGSEPVVSHPRFEEASRGQCPLEGERIVGAAPGLAPVARLVRAGSERFDGRGHPDGLAGDAIPLGARIIAVAVAFAALTSRGAQRPAAGVAEAMDELRADVGGALDPRVVAALAEDLAEETGTVSVTA